jgi:hypothetical protein
LQFWGKVIRGKFVWGKDLEPKAHNITMFFLKPYTLAGFEPGSAVSEADAMSTAPRRQGPSIEMFVLHRTSYVFILQIFWREAISKKSSDLRPKEDNLLHRNNRKVIYKTTFQYTIKR